MTTKDILDFTDYAKPLDFKFNDVLYRIPAFSKSQIESLMTINKKFIDKEPNIVPDEDNKISKEQIEESGSYFEMQDEFIACALFKQIGEEFKQVTMEELVDWPVKVKNRVMKAISEQMSATVDEDEPEKKS